MSHVIGDPVDDAMAVLAEFFRRHVRFQKVAHSFCLSLAQQRSSRLHWPHFGEHAAQTWRPCQMMRWEKLIHSAFGSTCLKSCSIFSGMSCLVDRKSVV